MKSSCKGMAGPREEMCRRCLKNYKMANEQEAGGKLPPPSLRAP